MADTWNERIRKIRFNKLAVSQDRFARLIGVAPVTVSRWERGLEPAGIGLMILRFLWGVIDRHPAKTIIEALDYANGDSMEIVRALVRLEDQPSMPNGRPKKPAPHLLTRRPPSSRPSLPPPSSVH